MSLLESACQRKNQAMRLNELSLELQDRIGLCRSTDLGKGTKTFLQHWRSPRTQWPPSILNGKSLEPLRLSLELAPGQTKKSGEKGLGQGGDQEPDGHSDRAPEFLCGDGRTFHQGLCGLSFSVADVRHLRHLSALTLAKMPAQTASLTASSEYAQTSWLECLQTYSISPYSSLLSPLASRCPPLFLYPRKQR
jgi:hypothetical protein